MNSIKKASELKRVHTGIEYLLDTGESLCLEYSDNPDKLQELMNKLQFKIRIKNPIFNKENKLFKLPVDVVINKGNQSIEFEFFASHNDSMAFLTTDKYQELTGDKTYWKSKYMKRFGRDCFDSTYGFKLEQKRRKARSKFLQDLKYSLLCDISCNLYISPIFDDFCDECGYNNDSRKDFELWQLCLKHNQKIMRIFNQEDSEVLPS